MSSAARPRCSTSTSRDSTSHSTGRTLIPASSSTLFRPQPSLVSAAWASPPWSQDAPTGSRRCGLALDNLKLSFDALLNPLRPPSATAGEGIPDLLQILVRLTQTMLTDRLSYVTELQCTVLEVKVGYRAFSLARNEGLATPQPRCSSCFKSDPPSAKLCASVHVPGRSGCSFNVLIEEPPAVADWCVCRSWRASVQPSTSSL